MLKSATKVVLLVLVFALIGLAFLQIEPSETFKYVITAVISFYFGQKQNPPTVDESVAKAVDPTV
jgi:cell division protein FtsW (lipid II flippase)